MAKFLRLLVAIPVAVVIVLFAIANRQIVSLSFDPFSDPSASSAVMTAPLFVILFVVLLGGTFLGGVAAWLSGGATRRRLREARDDAERWRAEVRRLHEQPPVVLPSSRQLARVGS